MVMIVMLQRTHLIDPALAKRRSNVYDVGPSLHQHRRNVRRWRSTEAADTNITPAGNIMYIFSVISIYELEPAAPNTQK